MTIKMKHNVLDHIRTFVDIMPDDHSFDQQLMGHIIQVLGTAKQLVTLKMLPHEITSDTQWSDLIGEAQIAIFMQFVTLSVKALFDPPSPSYNNSTLSKAIENATWRLKLSGDVDV